MEAVATPADVAPAAVPETPATPTETTKPLKLSEAIRIGAMMTTQVYGAFGDKDSTCAIGAAQVALGESPGSSHLVRALKRPARVDMPCGHGGTDDVARAVMHLNDTDHWPREKIATWLEDLGL